MSKQKVIICQDLEKDLNSAIQTCPHDKLFILVDKHTHELCFPLIRHFECLKDACIITIGAEDIHKNVETLVHVWTELGNKGGTRHSLMVNLGMIVGLTALFGATLTLPGVAGIVLTLGMAVDANVLPFERIRDEVRAGTPPLRAVNLGFERASKAVLDGNLTTLICGLVLFQFGAGPIRGFAVTLSIGILTTLFTCVWLTRVFAEWYMNGKNKKIGFVGGKK